MQFPQVGWVFHALLLSLWSGVAAGALVDVGFDVGARADGDILAMAQQADGKIVIVGEFATVNGQGRSYVARLNADGSLDQGFQTAGMLGASATVYAVAVQPDGRVLIGGLFSSVGGTARSYVARLKTDGTIDPTFDPGAGLDGPVRSMELQPDGRILIGGTFTMVGGQSRMRVARLLGDGSLDASFDPGSGANDYPRAFAVLPGGQILMVGRFTTFNGAAHGRIVRLNANGSVDATFNAGLGADRQIRALSVLPDGRFYVGGHFESYNGTNRSTVARLFPNGGLDLSFDQGNPSGDTVQALLVEPGGRVWIGGIVNTVAGYPGTLLAGLNPDGSVDPAANVVFEDLAGDELFAMHRQSDGLLLISGEFRWVNGYLRQRLARIIPPGAPTLVRVGAPVAPSGPEGGAVVFQIERVGPVGQGLSVNYATADGTAVGGLDFVPVSGTLTFGPDEIRKDVTVSLLPDLVFDPEESFRFVLSNPQGAVLGVPAVATARIVEVSPTIEFTQASFSQVEWGGDAGLETPTACVFLRRSGYVPGQTWSVDYEIIPGSARLGADFSGPLGGTVDFTIGNDYRCIYIPLINDGTAEPPETLTVRLTGAVGAVLTTNNVATLSIIDDDGPVELESTQWSVREGDGAVLARVRRNDNGPLPLAVDYVLGDGTARGGEDFVAASGTVTFAPGELVKTISIAVLEDCRIEADEWLTLTLSNPRGEAALGSNATARLLILDDERPGSVDPGFALSAELSPYEVGPCVVQSDGKILVGTRYRQGLIVRLHRDGALDSSFVATNVFPQLAPPFGGATAWSHVDGLAAIPDGRWIVTGRSEAFFPDGNYTSNHIVRLSADGVRDLTFQLDSRVVLGHRESPFSWTIIYERPPPFVVLPDGRVLVAGRAKAASGEWLSQNLVRLLHDGSLDESFRAELGLGWSDVTEVSSLALQPDGRVLVGGIVKLDGTNFSGIIRLGTNGTWDATFQPVQLQQWAFGFVYSAPPSAMALQSDGRVLAGGGFNRVNDQPRAALIRVHPDGAVETAFAPAAGLPAGVEVSLTTLILDERERIVISGALARALNSAGSSIVRLHGDGLRDASFALNDSIQPNEPSQLLPTSRREILAAGGYFGLLRINGDAYPWLAIEKRSGAAGWRLTSPSILGDTYRLQSSTDLQTWLPLESQIAGGCSVEFLLPDGAPRRFYRVERVPAP